MASFFDTLNEGLGNVTGTPLGQLGMGLLMASGQQQGNPGFGDRLGQAFGSVSELQRAQALQQYRQQLVAQQQQEQQYRVQQAQTKAEQDQQYQQRLQDPNFLASLGPLAQSLARMGVDPGQLIRAQNADNLQEYRAASLAQQQGQFDQRQAHQGGGGGSSDPRTPMPRQFVDKPLAGNMAQRYQYNPETQGYDAFGEPFATRSSGKGKPKTDPLEAVVDQLTPEVSGPAVPGLPGSNPLATPPQGRELLMVGNGASAKAQAPKSSAVASPQTKAQYDALPPGSKYVDPATGRIATKKAR
ncbi:hypothetical protein [Pseudomonas sp. JUb96]|uniref:hypothetical protein n=1 Tax=Pseudomonas sp. JUb96 TaxID=2940539 RepID=UPI0022263308|nr:hypothetical protein [Pseudomonas sp. JUb96]MCW2267595.1 hypothetical protein [Pseudomonas sp. JUb96]